MVPGLSVGKTAEERPPFLQEIREFPLREYQKMLDGFVNIGNDLCVDMAQR
jgi:hypothetical protein